MRFIIRYIKSDSKIIFLEFVDLLFSEHSLSDTTIYWYFWRQKCRSACLKGYEGKLFIVCEVMWRIWKCEFCNWIFAQPVKKCRMPIVEERLWSVEQRQIKTEIVVDHLNTQRYIVGESHRILVNTDQMWTCAKFDMIPLWEHRKQN